ncbi:MAG: hypothetical protein JWQ32_3272 [Marmoricola sp.]|nr:hypothetical protein [Marmoricola sp.]
MGERLLSSVPVVVGAPLPARARWTHRVALGARITNARVAAGMTQAELAGGLTSLAYLSRLETTERWPSSQLLTDLAHRLRVDPDALTVGGPPVIEGLRFELAHVDLLLSSGSCRNAAMLAGDLAEVATTVGSVEVANAARVVQASAMTLIGQGREALRILRPLAHTPIGLPAMVAAARTHLVLSNFRRAIVIAHRIAERIALAEQLSVSERAQLAVTVCEAQRLTGHHGAAGRYARRALKGLPAGTEMPWPDAPDSGAAALALSYRTFDQAVGDIERAVATVQFGELMANVDLLTEYAALKDDPSDEQSPVPSRQYVR